MRSYYHCYIVVIQYNHYLTLVTRQVYRFPGEILLLLEENSLQDQFDGQTGQEVPDQRRG